MKPILLGSDHAGYALKNFLKEVLTRDRVPVLDVGCKNETSCDYPVFARDLCNGILSGEASRGILVCGTGIGMSIAANRYHGIRAALCTTEFHAAMSRAHNDSNVLVLGSRVTGTELAAAILKAWLNTPFEGDRHQRRIDLIEGC
jgi:ribose 5-phosphate isomerase B